MITCPECGQQANDDAKFCDRCGQGLAGSTAHPAVISISPLDPNTEVKGAYRITALLSRTAGENRYRAVRVHDSEAVLLREQSGPTRQPGEAPALPEAVAAPSSEDPAGPRAKTAGLRLQPSTDRRSTNGSITQGSQSELATDAAPLQTEKETAAEISPAVQEDNARAVNAEERANEAGAQLLTEVIEEIRSPAPARAAAATSTSPELSAA